MDQENGKREHGEIVGSKLDSGQQEGASGRRGKREKLGTRVQHTAYILCCCNVATCTCI